MAKSKTGLQKKISSIFTGVSIPQGDGTDQPTNAPKPTTPGPTAPKPTTPGPTAPKPTVPKPTAPEPTAPCTTVPKPKQTQYVPPTTLIADKPKPQQAAGPPPKAVPTQKPIVETTIKVIEQSTWQQALEKIKNRFFAPHPGPRAKKQVTMTILIPALAIILIFVLIRTLGTEPAKPIKASGLTTASGTVNSYVKIDWKIPELYPTTLRDPMRPGSASITVAGDRANYLIVKGIVYSEQSPSAVIGDQIVHEGDKISDVTILKINRDNVEFEINGKKWTQKVQP